jgi:hypothetical protein
MTARNLLTGFLGARCRAQGAEDLLKPLYLAEFLKFLLPLVPALAVPKQGRLPPRAYLVDGLFSCLYSAS